MNKFTQPDIPLAEVEGNVQRTLKQIDAPPAFRARLRQGLMLAAQQRQAQRVARSPHASPPAASWQWWLGAILVGALVGFVMIQVYRRQASARLATE